MRLAVIAVLGVTACGDDPSLRVDVEHPIVVIRSGVAGLVVLPSQVPASLPVLDGKDTCP